MDYLEIWRTLPNMWDRKTLTDVWYSDQGGVMQRLSWVIFIVSLSYMLYKIYSMVEKEEEQEKSQEKENKLEDNRPRIDKNGADEIEKLSKLREKGILTEEEFDTKKKELLDRI